MVFLLELISDAFYSGVLYAFLFFGKTFFDANFCLKSPPVLDKNIQNRLGEMAGRGPKWGKVCVYHVLGMVLPGAMLWTHRCVCWTHWVVCWRCMVGAKFIFSLVYPYVMPCFWVVFTVFRGLVRHGCGGLVG